MTITDFRPVSETVDYTYKDVVLSQLPTAKKDYYFTIVKLQSGTPNTFT